MKIFVLPAIYPTKERQQLGIYIKEHCQALKSNYNHSFVVINGTTTGIRNWLKYSNVREYEDDLGYIYQKYTIGILQSKLPRFAIYTYRKNVERLFSKAIKNHGRPDLIYAHFSFPSGYTAMKLAEKYNIPYIVDEHYSLYFQEKLNSFIAKITKETMLKSKKNICVSERLRDALIKHTKLDKSSINVIPNLVNSRYKFSQQRYGDNFIFFSAGNFFPNKNFELLIDAFIKAFQPNEKVTLHIAGGGELEKVLSDKIIKSGRKHQIVLLGRLDSNEMLNKYIESNCFVLLSEYETFGIVYRESLAVGRPVISTKNGGIEEGWNDQYGLLLENNNVDCAADALRIMYESIETYDSKIISDLCLRDYSEKVIAKKVNCIIEQSVIEKD